MSLLYRLLKDDGLASLVAAFQENLHFSREVVGVSGVSANAYPRLQSTSNFSQWRFDEFIPRASPWLFWITGRRNQMLLGARVNGWCGCS